MMKTLRKSQKFLSAVGLGTFNTLLYFLNLLNLDNSIPGVEDEIFKLKVESCKLKIYKVRFTSICKTFTPKIFDNVPRKI